VSRPTLPPPSSEGIAWSLQVLAQQAGRDRLHPAVERLAHKLTDDQPTVTAKVAAIVGWLHRTVGVGVPDPSGQEGWVGLPRLLDGSLHGSLDVDDAVLVVATACLAVRIPCRIVGARFGQHWTVWLAYQDGDLTGDWWVTVDVLTGKSAKRVIPDEQIEVTCGWTPGTWVVDPGGGS
jgi:hypothetical protein